MSKTVEEIHNLNIVDVINAYSTDKLQKKGTTWKGLCPFHEEKTPSFTATPERGIFKCFGCGMGGDAITFVQEKEKLSFMEAVNDLADRFNLTRPKKMTDKEKEQFEAEQKHKEALKIVNEFAKDHYISNLKEHKPEGVKQRVSSEMALKFEIGYAPDSWNDLKNTAAKKQYKEHLLIDAGLVVNKDGKTYDRFRGRMIFPVYNHRGRIIGFSGRDITGNSDAKYINTPESDVFQKGSELFGLFQGKKAITNENHAILVEGNTDVTTLHGIGVENVVAPLGTAFTEKQAKLLRRYCDTVTVLGDGDKAGKTAAEKAGRLLVEQGFNVYIMTLPDEKDPDDFFPGYTKEGFWEYHQDSSEDFIIWLAKKLAGGNDDPHTKADAMDNVCKLLLNLETTRADIYIDAISKVIKPKKQWVQHIERLRAGVENNNSSEKDVLPEEVDPKDVEKYGFYEYKNKYYFRSKEGGYYPVSNFVLKPLFHIKLINDSTRLYEMVNVYGHKEIIEVDMQSMVSLQNFRRIIEGRGNYLFEGNEVQFMRLKRKLYDNTKTCELIEILGWQKEGFFAFSNGIYNGKFTKIDNKGIVEANNKYFFLPALSDIYKDDKTIYQPERKFQFIERNDTDLPTWSDMLIKVFGDNGKIAICFFIATLFKDYISQQFKFFPILNAFGPPGTGKSQLGWSMMYLFGEAQNPFNLHNGTKVGLAEHLAEFSNAFAWIDEYKNAVDYDKIEMLKSAYDLIGRKKGGIEKGKKTKTSVINAGIVLTGQEMPTADVALLKRVILLQFYQNEFTEKEQQNYDKLKEMEKYGLSHLTLEFLKYREQFEKEYFKVYDSVSSDLGKELQGVDVEDRIFRNMVIIVAAFRFFSDKVELNMTYEEIKKLARQNIVDQSSFIMNSQEIRGFWDTMESAVENGNLVESKDYKFDQVYELKVDDRTERFETPKKIISVKFSRIYEVYAETMRRTGQHALPKTTLIFYLKTSKEYLGIRKSVRFSNHVTNAYVFDYDKLNISLERDLNTTKTEEKEETNQGNKVNDGGDDLPF